MFVSHAQNFEDVILWRALKHVQGGFYIDIGAQDPIVDSVSKSFYDHGWRGIHAEATSRYAKLLREHRPDEQVIQAAIGSGQGTLTFYEIEGTGLSTGDRSIAKLHESQGRNVRETRVEILPLSSVFEIAEGRDIHWLKIDVEGMEESVIESWGSASARPWIVVVEATLPNTQTPTHESWEPRLLSYGYSFAYFDGLSRFYVSNSRSELLDKFGPGPNFFDGFTLASTSNFVDSSERLTSMQSPESDKAKADLLLVKAELEAIKIRYAGELKSHQDTGALLHAILNSRSWRLTAPIRLAAGKAQWVRAGLHAWATLRPGSRPYRYLRRFAMIARRFVLGSPFLYSLSRKLLKAFPGIQRRLRNLLLPPELRNLVSSTVPLAEPLHHSAHMRLAKERIDFARNYIDRFDKEDDRPPGRLPKLAYFSPVPPEKSGIADYSAQILPHFSEYYEVTLISDHSDISDPWLKENMVVRDTAWFKQNHGNFDRIVYHFGNSLLHSHMLPLLRSAPGVVVLHDFYLGSMLAYLELYGNWGPIWTNSLLSSHGYVSIANNEDPDSIRYCIDQFPANFEVISTATGVIVHNQHARRLAGSFYPTYTAETWQVVPLPRLIPPTSKRDEARKKLGFSEDDVIVCTFGFLGPTKQNDRLLDAWLNSPLAHQSSYKLVYVGEAHDDPYCHGLKARIQAKGRDRVSISGYVSRETYSLYLDAADIAVQLRTNSRGETSAAVLDCMAHGVPTIVNANGSMAELPDDCVVSLPDDFDVTELSDALLHLAQNRETRCSLGSRAASYTARVHTLAHAAKSYRDAIETFYRNSETIHDHNKLIAFARDLQSADDSNLNAARKLVSSTRFSRPTKQILIDISALRQQDLRTGIQRVVRSVLGAWFKGGEEGQYRIQPVYLDYKDGEWRYIYAHQYSVAFVGRPHADLADSPIDVDEGDIFLGLDHFAHGVTEAARAGLYSEMKRRGASVSFVVYDILPIRMPELFPPISTVIHNAWLEAVASVADQLICISQSVADDVAAWLKDNCHYRTNSVEVSSWHLGADIGSSAPTRGVPEDATRILQTIRSHSSFLMVGTIEPRKGYAQVVDAFERLWASGSEEILVIVGTEGWKDVPREAARSLPQLVSRLRNHPELGNRLIWLEKVSDEFLEQIYAAVSALIAASEGEGFGLPLIESAQHKVPIIARDIPVFREVAGDHAFYFDGKTGKELAASIRSWIQLRKEDKHPKSDQMPWLSWAESADQLLNAILHPVKNAPSAGAESQ